MYTNFSPNFLDPFFLALQQVDKGAIKFVLSGANIMCPGLTSKGAQMTPAPKGTVVVSFISIKNIMYKTIGILVIMPIINVFLLLKKFKQKLFFLNDEN